VPRPFPNLEFAPRVAVELNAYKRRNLQSDSYASLAFTAFDCECPTRESEAADFVGMLTCMRRSFFGSRQLTCRQHERSVHAIAVFMAMS